MDWSSIPGCIGSQGEAHLQCLPAVFKNLINGALILAGIAAVIFIILAAYRLITSHGDQQGVSKARKTLIFAIAGLLIILLSFFLVNFLGNITGTNCITQMGFTNCQ